MDYLTQPLGFKVRKVARYIRLYGVSRTYIKVLGQRHKQRRFAQLPSMRGRIADGQFVAIIGCGNFSFTTIAYYLTRAFGRTIGICMDRNVDRAASMSRHYGIPVYTTDVARVMEAEQVSSNQGTEYDPFKQAGVNVRLDGNEGQMHHKVFIIDEKIVAFGSYNFSQSAEESNDENILFVYSETIAREFMKEFERVWEQAQND